MKIDYDHKVKQAESANFKRLNLYN